MTVTLNKYLFETTLGHANRESSYTLVKTVCCGATCVFDARLNELYFTANDPGRHAALDFPQNCPLCAADPWSFSEISDRNLAGPWKSFL